MPYNQIPTAPMSYYGGLPPGIRSAGQTIPVSYPVPQGGSTPGFDWTQAIGPGIAGLGALGLGVGAAMRGGANRAPSYGGGGFLPGTQEMQTGLQDVGRLIQQLQTMRASPQALSQIENVASRQNTLQGLVGPAAATNVGTASGNFLAAFEQNRMNQLRDLLGLQSTIAGGIQAGEERRRSSMAQSRASQAQQDAALWSLIGTLLGGAAGSFIPGLGTAVGAGLGGALGSGFSGAFNPGY